MKDSYKPQSGYPGASPFAREENYTPPNKPDMFHAFTRVLILVISVPFRFLAAIMNHFTESGGVGAILLGSLVFTTGVLMTADTYWQSLFNGVALFPFFETTWAGWSWLPQVKFFPPRLSSGILLNGAFIFALAISFVIQIIQSATVRNAAFKVSSVGGISPKTLGLLAIACWTFDIIQTFSSRNPLNYSDPGMVFKCLMYNIFSIFAAELGYITYKMLTGGK